MHEKESAQPEHRMSRNEFIEINGAPPEHFVEKYNPPSNSFRREASEPLPANRVDAVLAFVA